MNKKELIDHVAGVSGATKAATGDVIDALIGTIGEELKGMGEFVLPGIGKLHVLKRPARQGRNPKTGETVPLPASNSVKFKQSTTLKAAVN